MSNMQLASPSVEDFIDVDVYWAALRLFDSHQGKPLPLMGALTKPPEIVNTSIGQLFDMAAHPDGVGIRKLRALSLAVIGSDDNVNHLLSFLLKSVAEEFDAFFEMALYCKAKHAGVHSAVRESLIYHERDTLFERIFALQAFDPEKDELIITTSLKFVIKELREHVVKMDKTLASLLGFAATFAQKANSSSEVFTALYKCCTKVYAQESRNCSLLEAVGLRYFDVLRIACAIGCASDRNRTGLWTAMLQEMSKQGELSDLDKSLLRIMPSCTFTKVQGSIPFHIVQYLGTIENSIRMCGLNVLRCPVGEEKLRSVFHSHTEFEEAVRQGIENYDGFPLTEEQVSLVQKYLPLANLRHSDAVCALLREGYLSLEDIDPENVIFVLKQESDLSIQEWLAKFPVNGLVFPERLLGCFEDLLEVAQEGEVPLIYKCAYCWRSHDTAFFDLIEQGGDGMEDILSANTDIIENGRRFLEQGIPFNLAEYVTLEELEACTLVDGDFWVKAYAVKAEASEEDLKGFNLDTLGRTLEENYPLLLGAGIGFVSRLREVSYWSVDVYVKAIECCVKYGLSDYDAALQFCRRENPDLLEHYPVLVDLLRDGVFLNEYSAKTVVGMTPEQLETFRLTRGFTCGSVPEEAKRVLDRVNNVPLFLEVVDKLGWDKKFEKIKKLDSLVDLFKIPEWLAEEEYGGYALLYIFAQRSKLTILTKLINKDKEGFLNIDRDSLLFDYRFISECVDWESFQGLDIWNYVTSTKSYDVSVSENDVVMLTKHPELQKAKNVLSEEDFLCIAAEASRAGKTAVAALLTNLEKHPIEFYKEFCPEWRTLILFNCAWDSETLQFSSLFSKAFGLYNSAETIPGLVAAVCKKNYACTLAAVGVSQFRVYSEYILFAELICNGSLDWLRSNEYHFYGREEWHKALTKNWVNKSMHEWAALAINPQEGCPITVPKELQERFCTMKEEQFDRMLLGGGSFHRSMIDNQCLSSDDNKSQVNLSFTKEHEFCLLLECGEEVWAASVGERLELPVYKIGTDGEMLNVYSKEAESPGEFINVFVTKLYSGGKTALPQRVHSS